MNFEAAAAEFLFSLRRSGGSSPVPKGRKAAEVARVFTCYVTRGEKTADEERWLI